MEEKVIEAVHSKRVLYDTGHADYMRSKLKQGIWSKIAKDIHLKDGDEVKAIWGRLRNCHRDALRRQRNSSKSGFASGKQWKYQRNMEFLLPFMTNRPRESNFDDDIDSDLGEDADSENELNDKTTAADNEEQNEEMNDSETGNNDHAEDYTTYVKVESVDSSRSPSCFKEPYTKQIAKKKKTDDIPSLLTHSVVRCELGAYEEATERKNMQDDKQNNSLYHFFMSMYETTKKMPQSSQHIVKRNIFEAVSQVEAHLLNLTYANHQHSSTVNESSFNHPQPSSSWPTSSPPAARDSTCYSPNSVSSVPIFTNNTMQ